MDVISGYAGDPNTVDEDLQPRLSRRRSETRAKLEASIAANGLTEPWKMKSWRNWLHNVIAKVWNTVCSWLGTNDAKVAYLPHIKAVLMRTAKLSEAEATTIANEISEGIQ